MWAEGDTFKMNGCAYEIAAGIRGLQIKRADGLTIRGSYVQDIWCSSPEVTFGEHWLDIGKDFRHRAKKIRRIRSTHRYSFRSGEWAELIGDITVPFPASAGTTEHRRCRVVRFADGVCDYWAIKDPSDTYEFADGEEQVLTPPGGVTLHEALARLNQAVVDVEAAYAKEIEAAIKTLRNRNRG
jgi:hypothetical protein